MRSITVFYSKCIFAIAEIISMTKAMTKILPAYKMVTISGVTISFIVVTPDLTSLTAIHVFAIIATIIFKF